MAAFDDAVCRAIHQFGVTELKPEQTDILKAVIEGKDCMAILPTGYGKSLPHQIYTLVKGYMDPTAKKRVLVCSPLVSLMEDQVQRLSSLDIRATYKGKSVESDAAIERGEMDVIFSSPESLLTQDWIRQVKDVSLIVIDEFHTVATWGGMEKEDEDKVFRKWFRHVGELRSLYPEASLLALSATCTLQIKKRVTDLCNFNVLNTHFIEISPNRDNIKIVVKKTSPDVSETFYWLVDKLLELKDEFPRVIIFCNSIQDVSKLYFYLKNELEENSKYIEMFHSETALEKKQTIVHNLGIDSNVRVVIATSALGMGIDINNCQCIILFGAPKNIVDLLQQIGRCGRDGQNSVSFILYNRYHLRNISCEVKNVLTSTKCRRVEVLKEFQSDVVCISNLHYCCDICTSSCKCGACVQHPFEKLINDFQPPSSHESNDESDSSSETLSYEYQSDLDTI